MKWIAKSVLLTGFGVTCGVIGAGSALMAAAVGMAMACQKQPKLQKMFVDGISESIADLIAPKSTKSATGRYTYAEWQRVQRDLKPKREEERRRMDSMLRVVEDHANNPEKGGEA